MSLPCHSLAVDITAPFPSTPLPLPSHLISHSLHHRHVSLPTLLSRINDVIQSSSLASIAADLSRLVSRIYVIKSLGNDVNDDSSSIIHQLSSIRPLSPSTLLSLYHRRYLLYSLLYHLSILSPLSPLSPTQVLTLITQIDEQYITDTNPDQSQLCMKLLQIFSVSPIPTLLSVVTQAIIIIPLLLLTTPTSPLYGLQLMDDAALYSWVITITPMDSMFRIMHHRHDRILSHDSRTFSTSSMEYALDWTLTVDVTQQPDFSLHIETAVVTLDGLSYTKAPPSSCCSCLSSQPSHQSNLAYLIHLFQIIS